MSTGPEGYTTGGSMLGKWNYSAAGAPSSYGDDDETYKRAMSFLDGCGIVEDWGCGTAYAKKFLKSGIYVGIDGSPSPFTTTVADLRVYRSEAGGILLRHVLEHNWEWEKILDNAVASFRKKLVLVFFIPFGPAVQNIGKNWNGVPGLVLRREDIMKRLKPFGVKEESLETKTQYKQEQIFYVERK